MADYDVATDTTPALPFPHVGDTPTIAALKTAIAASGVAAKYPTARLQGATKNDLVYICRLEGIAVAGI